MKRCQESAPKPVRVIGVGGGGCNLDTSSVVFRIIRNKAEELQLPYDMVHGCDDVLGAHPRVVTPAEQQERIGELVAVTPESKRIVLVGQCMSSIAITNYLHDNPDESRVSGVLIAPATRPGSVLAMDKSSARRLENDTIMRAGILQGDYHEHGMKVERSIRAELPAAYLEQVRSEEYEMYAKMEAQAVLGRLALLGAELDWNKDSVHDIRRMRDDHPELHDVVRVIPQAGHSLHTPRELIDSYDERLLLQQRRVCHLLNGDYAAIE